MIQSSANSSRASRTSTPSKRASDMTSLNGSTMPTLVVRLERERARALVRAAFPRRRWKIITTRSAEELEAVFRRVLVDAALIDLGAPDEDIWKSAAFAAEFPST